LTYPASSKYPCKKILPALAQSKATGYGESDSTESRPSASTAVSVVTTAPIPVTPGAYIITGEQTLRFNNSDHSNRVIITWDNGTQLITVKYIDQSAWFNGHGVTEKQYSILAKDGKEIPDVVSRIVEKGDVRGRDAFGSVTLKFYMGNSVYQFENGNYSIFLDIVTDNYHHTAVEMFAFNVTVN
jgi:hypothetical protein